MMRRHLTYKEAFATPGNLGVELESHATRACGHRNDPLAGGLCPIGNGREKRLHESAEGSSIANSSTVVPLAS